MINFNFGRMRWRLVRRTIGTLIVFQVPLAEFRYPVRFLKFSERAASEKGLQPQQHQVLLAIKGAPGEQERAPLHVTKVAHEKIKEENAIIKRFLPIGGVQGKMPSATIRQRKPLPSNALLT